MVIHLWDRRHFPSHGTFAVPQNVRQRTVTATVSGYALVVVAFINERKENTVAVAVAALTGCISIGSKEPGPQGPPGPKGDSGNTEKVIVVPEKRY